MDKIKLHRVAVNLVAKDKGILAADESFGTIEKKFKAINLPSTESNRQKYRDLLLTAPGTGKYLSGVILFDETIKQNSVSGRPFTDVLHAAGIIPGIKVDAGAKDLPGFSPEQITYGLDGLAERLSDYSQRGAAFAKWRAVITIGEGIPTDACIEANMQALARYASLAQAADIVPIVEPEVLMDGSHSLQACRDITAHTLTCLFRQLALFRVYVPGIILKPNMISSGSAAETAASAAECATATVETFKTVVPAEVPGIVFLSGGFSPDEATKRLNLINQVDPAVPWQLTFSFGRALQQEPLMIWQGKDENIPAAQSAFIKRLELVSKARNGKIN